MLIIFDKDGTLVHNYEARPANSLEEQTLLPGVLERCAALREQGHTLAIATNQGGVAFGYFTADEAHAMIADLMRRIGAAAYAVCVCHPHGTIAELARESDFRKPNPGMLRYLMDALGFAAADTLYVGDIDTDEETARRAGVRFAQAKAFFSGSMQR